VDAFDCRIPHWYDDCPKNTTNRFRRLIWYTLLRSCPRGGVRGGRGRTAATNCDAPICKQNQTITICGLSDSALTSKHSGQAS
jgi:hypothetical protein